MKRQNRTVLVLVAALGAAGLASFGVLKAIQQMPVREVEVASVNVVVAAEVLPVGTRIRAEQLKVVKWPARGQVTGAFSKPADLVDRGVISTIGINEPVTTSKVASAESGAGLPPIIPEGMRAISVKVNEVVGVAGFVMPGTRVDVVVTVDGVGNSQRDPMSRTVLSNVQVLTSGTRYDQEQAKDGKPVPTTVVTLAVTPEDGERIALASSEGTISLALRNPLDVHPTKTQGIKLAALMNGNAPPPVVNATPRRVVVRTPVVAPEPAPKPSIYTVETIRAAKRNEEVVR